MLPTIVVHRGLYSATAVENTLAAFADAVHAGFDWVECDIQESADAVDVLMHDETLDRTTNGSGRVAEARWEDLSKLQVRTPAGTLLGDGLHRIANLSEAFFLDKLSFLVEIKPPNAPRLVRRLVDDLQRAGRNFILQSFDEANLAHALAIDLEMPVALLVEDKPALQRAIKLGLPAIHLNHTLLTRSIAWDLHRRGISVGVWTVNEDADIRRIAHLHPDLIITDRPRRVRDICREIG